MHLKPETLKKIHEMTLDPDYQGFFEQLGNESDVPKDLMSELVDMFLYEMELGTEKRDDLMFLARLAYMAGRAGGQG